MLALVAAGCTNSYVAPLKPPTGAFVSTQTVPLTVKTPPTGLSFEGLSKGSTESCYFLWPYPTFDMAWGDAFALGKANHSGHLSSIAYAEVEVLTVFSLFGRYTVNVYGTPSTVELE